MRKGKSSRAAKAPINTPYEDSCEGQCADRKKTKVLTKVEDGERQPDGSVWEEV
jgi:hypothetical protein